MFDYSSTELTVIDRALEPKLQWATTRRTETEQLAMDATRLLSCTEDRLDTYKKKGFFKRCYYKLSGKQGDMMRANIKDLSEMQKYAWRYLNLLQEQNLMLAHSMITLKNNLRTLAIAEMETRREIERLANRIAERFEEMDKRLKNVEAATNIHGWLLTIDTMDYDEKYTTHMRLIRLIRDFFTLKSGDWTMTEIRYLHKAIKETGIEWKRELTLKDFASELIDEIDKGNQYNGYHELISFEEDYDEPPTALYVIENIAVPSYCSLYQIDDQYQQASTTIDILSKHLSISRPEAMKKVMTGLMEEQGLDLHIAVPIRDLAVELLHCNNLMKGLMGLQTDDATGQMTTKKGVSVAVIEAPPKTYICPVTGMEFVFVKGGKFKMGDIWGDGGDGEKPVHEVELDDFYMGKYPVTVGQFRIFVDETGYKTEAETGGGCVVWNGEDFVLDERAYWLNPGFNQTGKDPVVCVSWNDAKKYTEWISSKTDGKYRLPYEAEWEYAASWAGEGKKHKWAGTDIESELKDYAWYIANSDSKPHPVGQKKANALGLYDMSGNVWEWCMDWYDKNYYKNSPKKNPTGPNSGDDRVMRGGSWNHLPFNLRVAYRLNLTPAYRNYRMGLRLLRTL